MEIIRACGGGFHCCNAFNLLHPISISHPPFRVSAPATDLNLSMKPKLHRRKSTARSLLGDRNSGETIILVKTSNLLILFCFLPANCSTVFPLEFPDFAAKGSNADLSLSVKKMASDISVDMKGTSVFLLGMNSSIKSNLGMLLADALRYHYIDSDSVVEESIGGKTVATSIPQSDEGFQEAETEVLRQLSSMGRLVVSAGNGAVRSATNLGLLRHGISVWIDVPLKLVAREVMEDKVQMPAFEIPIAGSYSEVLAQLTGIYEERQGGYATADTTISLLKVASRLGYDNLESVGTEELCLEVLKEISKLMRVKKMMEDAGRPF
ncbi:hypothetical protein DM860_000873 [Cuscuta australis]|uniref:Shikimate kinase n=1 Tax=Cuscuta australis TaxID=267555 RepID=A0A328D1D9_9ASTE|nr:hypothetical protein DM860_000873 [Cuscuta australis]